MKFKPGPGGGFTNGELFTDHEVSDTELGEIVRSIAGAPASEPCPNDEWPAGYVPEPPMSDVDAGVAHDPDAG